MAIFEVFGCFRLLKCNNWWFKQFIVMYLHEIYPTVPQLSQSDVAFRFYDQKTTQNCSLHLGHNILILAIYINGPIFQKVNVLSSWKLFKCDSSLCFSLETHFARYHPIILASWGEMSNVTRASMGHGPISPRWMELQVWLVCHFDVPMVGTNWYSN